MLCGALMRPPALAGRACLNKNECSPTGGQWSSSGMRPGRGGAVVSAQRCVALPSASTGLSKGAHPPSSRSTFLTSHACVSRRVPQATQSSAERRAGELLTLRASRTSRSSTPVAAALPEPVQRMISSARCDGGGHRRGTREHCGLRSRFAWPCAVKLDRQSLLLSTVDPPSITLGAGGSCRAPQKQWGACYAMLL